MKKRRKRTKQENVCWLSERCRRCSQARNRFHFADSEHFVGISAVGCAAHVYRMPRGLPSCNGLLNFRKGLNDNGNGLIQSIFRNHFSSRAQGVRCLSSLHVTPEGPAVDELFELQVCILYFHTYQRLTQLNSSLTRLVNWSPTL